MKDFTDLFHKQYGVECVSALHHNKCKINYHIHLIFSEGKLLPELDVKVATRSVFSMRLKTITLTPNTIPQGRIPALRDYIYP